MSADLKQIFERLDFCEAEINVLAREIAKFVSYGISIRTEPTEGGFQNIFITQTHATPTSLLSRTGMITNEIRCCLDALACQLAIRNDQSPDTVYFPISKSKAIFDDDGRRKLRKLSPGDRQKIEDQKPWRRDDSILFGIHEADRTRKHTRLVSCASYNAEVKLQGSITVKRGVSIEKLVLEETVVAENFDYSVGSRLIGNIVGLETLLIKNAPVKLNITIGCSIGFVEPEDLSGKEVLTTLREFALEVRRIVSLFV